MRSIQEQKIIDPAALSCLLQGTHLLTHSLNKMADRIAGAIEAVSLSLFFFWPGI